MRRSEHDASFRYLATPTSRDHEVPHVLIWDCFGFGFCLGGLDLGLGLDSLTPIHTLLSIVSNFKANFTLNIYD